MMILYRVVAVLFAGLDYLGYVWWDRSYLSDLEQLYELTPAICLLVGGLAPQRLFALAGWRIGFVALGAVAIVGTIESILQAVRSPIEPDKAAIILGGIVLVLLSIGVAFALKAGRRDSLEPTKEQASSE